MGCGIGRERLFPPAAFVRAQLKVLLSTHVHLPRKFAHAAIDDKPHLAVGGPSIASIAEGYGSVRSAASQTPFRGAA
jgi:hypothetical protein